MSTNGRPPNAQLTDNILELGGTPHGCVERWELEKIILDGLRERGASNPACGGDAAVGAVPTLAQRVTQVQDDLVQARRDLTEAKESNDDLKRKLKANADDRGRLADKCDRLTRQLANVRAIICPAAAKASPVAATSSSASSSTMGSVEVDEGTRAEGAKRMRTEPNQEAAEVQPGQAAVSVAEEAKKKAEEVQSGQAGEVQPGQAAAVSVAEEALLRFELPKRCHVNGVTEGGLRCPSVQLAPESRITRQNKISC